MATTTTPNIEIELGSIIQFNAPSDPRIHNNTFLVSYIDDDIIDIQDNKGETIVKSIDDLSTVVESVKILYTNPNKGFIAQQGFKLNMWLNIYFGGENPTIITCEITDIEDDMMTLTTYPKETEKTLYIDFEYKGLPRNLPIEKIEIRNSPYKSMDSSNVKTQEEIETQEMQDDLVAIQEVVEDEQQEQMIEELFEDAEIYVEGDGNSGNFIKSDEHQQALDEGYGELIFGEDLGEIEIEVDVRDSEKRFSLESQTTDLLNQMLSEIPPRQRTDFVMKIIQKQINRFVELRSEFSKTQNDDSISIEPKTHGANNKPLKDSLTTLQDNDWLDCSY